MDLFHDDDLGLDDVEYFKEFLKFKKNRALLKAKEAEEASLEVEKKAVGAIEAGSNPPPPGTSPELSINPSPPPYIPEPIAPKSDANGSNWPPKENQVSQVNIYETALSASVKEVAPPALVGQDVRDSDEVSHSKDRDRGRDRDREKADPARSREYDSRPRPRYRSRSRERESWRQQRRSRSRSRSPRDRRDRYDPRLRYDGRYQPRRRSRETSPRRNNNYSPAPAPPADRQNFGYGAPHMMEQMRSGVAAPPMPTEWNPMAGVQHWEQRTVEIPYQVSAEEQARKLAIEKEQLQQKETFISQRKEYLKKRENFIVELGLLKGQRRELSSKSKLPEVQKIIAGNIKLQEEITTKIKSVDNVLDMLKGLIGDDGPEMKPMTPPSPDRESDKDNKKAKKRKRSRSGSESSTAKESERRSRSRKRDGTRDRDEEKAARSREKDLPRRGREEQFNMVYYDPEVHWCRSCKVFPSTAKEYLLHLHSPEHKDMTQDRKLDDLPWHDLAEHKEPVVIKGLETKKCPIKGLQFFEASTAWFCKLCRSWMGDLHCASVHLKSEEHNNKYEDFSMNNPKWEATWLSDRGKAVVSSGKKEDILKRQLEEQLLLQKKHEEELKLTLEAKHAQEARESGLVMPLNLLTRPAPKIKEKDNQKKKKSKDKKKSKKKKRAQSSGSSGSSPSSSGSSSSSDEEKKKKEKKSKKKKAALPEKSKWEKDDSDEESSRRRGASDQGAHRNVDTRRMRNYRWAENLARPTRPASPPHVPEKHTILIPESTKLSETTRQPPTPVPPPPSQVPPLRMRNRDRDDDGESRFDKQAQASAKKKPSSQPASKTKFAFIGRMPFTKRKSEVHEEKSSKEQDVATPDPTPPPPPVISKKVVPVEAPPPVLTNKTKVVVAKEILTKSQSTLLRPEYMAVDPVIMEVDMEIDKEPSPPPIQLPPSPPRIRLMPVLPPEVTTNLGKKSMAVPLPKDFQDALSIIYPEPVVRESTPPLPPPPPSLPARISTPSPPPLPEIPQPPSPPSDFESMHKMADYDDFDEMALLGIDKEDMAALRF